MSRAELSSKCSTFKSSGDDPIFRSLKSSLSMPWLLREFKIEQAVLSPEVDSPFNESDLSIEMSLEWECLDIKEESRTSSRGESTMLSVDCKSCASVEDELSVQEANWFVPQFRFPFNMC